MKRSYSEKILRAFFISIAVIFTVTSLFPFIWSFYTSLRPLSEVFEFSIDFSNLSLDSYSNIINNFPISKWYINSIFVSITFTVLSILMSAACGYSLARIEFKAKRYLFACILAVMMIPGQILMIPTYIIIHKLGWINTYQALIVPFLFNAMNIYLFRQFYLNFPKDLEESAHMDGLGRIGIFFKIALPVAKAPVITLIILNFIGNWNSFIYPNLLTTSQNMYTLPVGLKLVEGEYFSKQNDLMAAAMFVTIPIIIFYITTQKHLSQGIGSTGGKE